MQQMQRSSRTRLRNNSIIQAVSPVQIIGDTAHFREVAA